MEKKYDKFGEMCFWLGIMIEMLVVLIDKSAYINPYESLIFRFTFLLFGIKIITTKYSAIEWTCIVLAGVLAFISYYINERDEMVRAVVLIAACKNISLQKEFKTIFYLTVAGCCIIVILARAGLLGAMSVTTDYGRGGIETRYVFGMGHPNAFYCMLWCSMLLFLYTYFDKIKLYHYIIMLLLGIACYLFTRSNTGIMIVMLTLIGTLAMQYINSLRNQKIIYGLGAVIVLFCIIFSLWGAYRGNGLGDSTTFMYKLDKILNGRYESCYKIEDARLINWKLFGNFRNQEYFDAGFVRVFYWYGIIAGIAYTSMNLYLIYASWKNRDCMLLVMICVISIYSLMEAHFISVYLLRNYLLLLFGNYWYQPLEKEKYKEGYLWQFPKLLIKEI